MKYALIGITCVVLAFAFVVGSNYYKEQQVEKYGFMAATNAELFVRDHSPTLGSDDAKVHIIEGANNQFFGYMYYSGKFHVSVKIIDGENSIEDIENMATSFVLKNTKTEKL